MKAAAGLALLAGASLGLTVLRYGTGGDADAAFQSRLTARLAAAEVLVVGVTTTPAFRSLRLRKLGCASTGQLAFAPNDGEADAALRRLLPDAAGSVLPGAGALHPGWLIRVETGDTRGCVATETVRRVVAHASG